MNKNAWFKLKSKKRIIFPGFFIMGLKGSHFVTQSKLRKKMSRFVYRAPTFVSPPTSPLPYSEDAWVIDLKGMI